MVFLRPLGIFLKKLTKLSKGKEIIKGQAFPRAGFGKASLSSSQGKEVALRLKGGRISKNIIPVIIHKKKKRKNYNNIITKRVA